jgi:hypothetical protein
VPTAITSQAASRPSFDRLTVQALVSLRASREPKKRSWLGDPNGCVWWVTALPDSDAFAITIRQLRNRQGK